MSDRPIDLILSERSAHLALLATEAMYEAQPELWERGEKGRFHTMDDLAMHFRAVAEGEAAFRSHVEYCYRLFEERQFPKSWLDDAWTFMRSVARADLSEPALAAFLSRLDAVVGSENS